MKAQLDKASVTAAMAELGIEMNFAAFPAVGDTKRTLAKHARVAITR